VLGRGERLRVWFRCVRNWRVFGVEGGGCWQFSLAELLAAFLYLYQYCFQFQNRRERLQ